MSGVRYSPPVAHEAHGVEQLARIRGLGDEAARAGGERRIDGRAIVRGREHDDRHAAGSRA